MILFRWIGFVIKCHLLLFFALNTYSPCNGIFWWSCGANQDLLLANLLYSQRAAAAAFEDGNILLIRRRPKRDGAEEEARQCKYRKVIIAHTSYLRLVPVSRSKRLAEQHGNLPFKFAAAGSLYGSHRLVGLQENDWVSESLGKREMVGSHSLCTYIEGEEARHCNRNCLNELYSSHITLSSSLAAAST